MKITQKLIKKLLSKRFRDDREFKNPHLKNPHYRKQVEYSNARMMKSPEFIAMIQKQIRDSQARRMFASSDLSFLKEL